MSSDPTKLYDTSQPNGTCFLFTFMEQSNCDQKVLVFLPSPLPSDLIHHSVSLS